MTDARRPHQVRPKRIGEIERIVPESRVYGDDSTLVRGMTHDSRSVRAGDLYLARAGAHTHGIDHLDAAARAGAAAVLTDAPSVAAARNVVAAVVEVADPRAATGSVAAWVYDDPSAALLVLGVTGTNGKTTTTFLLEGALQATGLTTGLLGTVETHIGAEAVPSARTTPEATDLQALFAVMRESDVGAVAMEVSSHALDLGRVDGTTFAVAGFTNLSQDHLDFHGDMEAYFAAKAQLFTPAFSRRGVVCVDDEWGRRLADLAGVPVLTVGRRDADWTWEPVRLTAAGGTVRVTDQAGETVDLDVALPGEFNLANAVLAYVMVAAAGLPTADAARGIASVRAVPGRMERVDRGQPFATLVDYAHTPDALALLVRQARDLAGPDGRVLVVVGCGGDRDRGKRPAMGAAAATADVAVLTSDNPRSEDPAAILEAMTAGISGVAGEVYVEPDRRTAIGAALDRARPGDVVVVAGKGHERTQEFADRTVPFDDRVVLTEALAERGWAGEAA